VLIQGFPMEALMARFDLTDAEWLIIAPLLPGVEDKRNVVLVRTIARFSMAFSSFCEPGPDTPLVVLARD
jgi:transposase